MPCLACSASQGLLNCQEHAADLLPELTIKVALQAELGALSTAIMQRKVPVLEAALAQGNTWLDAARGAARTMYKPQVRLLAALVPADLSQAGLSPSLPRAATPRR